MQNDNTIADQPKEAGTASVFPGVHLVVDKEHAVDYLQMRAAQLSALNHLLTSGDFDGWSQTIQGDAKWLAASLASEVSQLLSVVTFG